MAHT
jgi:cytochrome c oxidase assembly protein subunit 11